MEDWWEQRAWGALVPPVSAGERTRVCYPVCINRTYTIFRTYQAHGHLPPHNLLTFARLLIGLQPHKRTFFLVCWG